MDVIQGPSGSYNSSSYEGCEWPSFREPKYPKGYIPGLLGPECLLISVEVGSSHKHLHAAGDYAQWCRENGRPIPDVVTQTLGEKQ